MQHYNKISKEELEKLNKDINISIKNYYTSKNNQYQCESKETKKNEIVTNINSKIQKLKDLAYSLIFTNIDKLT